MNKPTKKYLPVGLDVRGRICIVVGGGQIGTRKVATLLWAGADVTLVSPHASDELENLAGGGEIRWLKRGYEETDLRDAFLAVVATDNQEQNARVAQDALQQKVLVCDASSASRSEVIFGALHEGHGITLAVFTDGQDPSLARRTRNRIAALEEEWGEK